MNDRIAGSPEQQDRDPAEASPARSSTRSSAARLGDSPSSGMSATKSPTARRRSADEYGARSAARTPGGSAGPGQPRGAADEGRRPDANRRRGAAGLRASRIRSGAAAPAGSDTPGVGQHDPREPILMALGPAERDRSAPIVRRDDDPAGDATAAVMESRSSIRSARVRGRSSRSE